MKIMVTGASGFVGSTLTRALVSSGLCKPQDVRGMVRYVSGGRFLASDENQVMVDLRDGEGLLRAVSDFRPDVVIHLAAQSAVSYSFTHAEEVADVNYMGTVRLVEAIKADKSHPYLISASSSEVYGTSKRWPVSEEDALGGTSPYAAAKIAGEECIRVAGRTGGLQYTIVRPFNCYDQETEILTKEGFKRFTDLRGDELVATLEPTKNEMHFERPSQVTVQEYSGPMIRVRGSQVDLLVTPNHRMWVKSRHRRLPYWEIAPAADLLAATGKRTWAFQHAAQWRGSLDIPEGAVPPGVPLLTWLSFLGWFMSEGSLDRRHRHKTVDIRQNPGEKQDEIFAVASEVASSFERKAHRYNYEEGPTALPQGGVYPVHIGGRVRIYSTRLVDDYLAPIYEHSRQKRVPSWVKELPKQFIGVFLEAYQRGDGSRGKSMAGYEVRDVFLSSSQGMLDDLQELCLKMGWGATKQADRDGAGNGAVYIARTRVETTPRTDHNFLVQPYCGKVGCVSVSSGLVFVRRNGRVVVSGNTIGRAPLNNRNFVVERAITQAIEQGAISLHDPRPLRDFLFRDDHVAGYVAIVRAIAEGRLADVRQQTFNLSTGDTWSIREMANLVADEVGDLTGGRKIGVSFLDRPDRPLDIPVLWGSNAKARGVLGWEPKYPIVSAIKEASAEWIERLWKEK